jgi:hypothetical protein
MSNSRTVVATANDRQESDTSSQVNNKEAMDEIKPICTNETTRHPPAAPLVNGKLVLRVEDAWEKTAYAWSDKKKWALLSVVAICQTSMVCIPPRVLLLFPS